MAVALKDAGFVVEAIVARPQRRSIQNARDLAGKLGTRVITDLSELTASVIWFCVPDSEIARIAASSAEKLIWKGRAAFHSSGALTSDEFRPLRRRGAAVASVHPLMTFVRGSNPSLAGVPFAVEGDAVAVQQARRIVRGLGGEAYPIRKQYKAAYHAWGMFASPLLTALIATTERVAAVAGISPQQARRRMLPILQQTLANYAANGGPEAFSGPIIRGDVETVQRHLAVLRSAPIAREVYAALAHAALDYLPAKNKAALRQALRV